MRTRGGPVRRGSRLDGRRTTVALTVAGALLSGCGAAQVSTDQDLCLQYDQLVDKVQSLESIDPDTVTVDELRAEVARVEKQLDALQAVAEGQLDTVISNLRTAVNDLVTSAADAGQQALAATQPLLGETLDDISEAWATLQLAADAKCGEN